MERRTNPNKAKFRHQAAAGRYALLAVAGMTLVNLLLLLFRAEYRFLLSAALPYYVNWLCVKLEAHWIFCALAVLLAVALEGFYCICWFLSQRRIFLQAALGAYALDTVLLVIFAFTLLDNPASCVLEILTHGAVIYLLVTADGATAAMERLRRRSRTAEPVEQKERMRV